MLTGVYIKRVNFRHELCVGTNETVRNPRVSVERGSTVITLTNHNRFNSMNKSELKANTCNRRQARENACEQVMSYF